MENPATWGEAERIVHEVYQQWWKDREEMRMGLSLARRTTDALRQAGLMKDEEEK